MVPFPISSRILRSDKIILFDSLFVYLVARFIAGEAGEFRILGFLKCHYFINIILTNIPDSESGESKKGKGFFLRKCLLKETFHTRINDFSILRGDSYCPAYLLISRSKKL